VRHSNSSNPRATSYSNGYSGQHHTLATLLPQKTWYPLYRRLGGPGAGLNGTEKLMPTVIRSLLWVTIYVLCHSSHRIYNIVTVKVHEFHHSDTEIDFESLEIQKKYHPYNMERHIQIYFQCYFRYYSLI